MLPAMGIGHEDFMGLAIDQARLAARRGEVPVGAVVVADGCVIGAAHNRRELDQDPTAHGRDPGPATGRGQARAAGGCAAPGSTSPSSPA